MSRPGPQPESRVRYSGTSRALDVRVEVARQFPDEKGFTDTHRQYIAAKVTEGRIKLLTSDDPFNGFRYGIKGQEGMMAVVGTREHERNGHASNFSYCILATEPRLVLKNVSPETMRETAHAAESGLDNRFRIN